MIKIWIALIVTNAIWAGWAMAQTYNDTVGAPLTIGDGIPLPTIARVLAVAAQDSNQMGTIIRTDKDGYVICSPERKPIR